jgi:hypothetical protein
VTDPLLEGAVDLHVHGGPDVVPRRYTDLELAARARDAGMRAIVLKSHVESTVGRAASVAAATGLEVHGGLVLNAFASGGVDPEAVELSLQLGARVIWMPTVASAAHMRAFPVYSVRPARPTPVRRAALAAICASVSAHDALLATGHLGPRQVRELAGEAARAGARTLVQHPDWVVPDLAPGRQAALAGEFPGLVFERCAYAASPGSPRRTGVADIAAAIQATGGAARNVIASDLGQPENAAYPDGLADFARAIVSHGLPARDVATMLAARPAELLGI